MDNSKEIELTKEKYQKWFEAIAESTIKRAGINHLLDWLKKTDFYEAPASTRFHNSCEQGLVAHSINVYSELAKLCNLYGFENTEGFDNETIAIVALFHDLCKINFYEKTIKNEKVYCETGDKQDELGTFTWVSKHGYKVKDDYFPLGHGEQSMYLIERFMRLKPYEAIAIRWHMGFSDVAFKGGDLSIGKAFDDYPLATLLNAADLLSTSIIETKQLNDSQEN